MCGLPNRIVSSISLRIFQPLSAISYLKRKSFIFFTVWLLPIELPLASSSEIKWLWSVHRCSLQILATLRFVSANHNEQRNFLSGGVLLRENVVNIMFPFSRFCFTLPNDFFFNVGHEDVGKCACHFDSHIKGSYTQEARVIHPIYAPLKHCNLRYSMRCIFKLIFFCSSSKTKISPRGIFKGGVPFFLLR